MEASFYPEIEPYNTGKLRVAITHNIYFEECGNPEGKPVVFLHGGPGEASRLSTGAFLILLSTALYFSISAAQEKARPQRNCTKIPPGSWWGTSKNCANI